MQPVRVSRPGFPLLECFLLLIVCFQESIKKYYCLIYIITITINVCGTSDATPNSKPQKKNRSKPTPTDQRKVTHSNLTAVNNPILNPKPNLSQKRTHTHACLVCFPMSKSSLSQNLTTTYQTKAATALNQSVQKRETVNGNDPRMATHGVGTA